MKKNFQEYIIIFSLWMLVFAASSQIMIISPILPRIGEELNIGKELQGTLVSAYAILVGIFALIMGPISDKIGRRRILLIGTGVMSIALFMHNFAIDYFTLITARSFAGMAGGVLSGAAVSYVGDYFPYEKRGWANGWIMSGIAMGQIVGIPMGTVLADMFSFQAPFVVFGIVMAFAFFLILKYVPQPNVELDVNKLSIGSALSKYLIMLKNKEVIAASTSYLLMFLSMSIFIVFMPTWLEESFNVGGNEIASLFLIGGIANVMTGPLIGKISDKIGRKRIIITSCVGFSLVISTLTYTIQSFWVSYPIFFIIMVLVAMRISPFQALLTAIVDAKQRGALMSLMIGIGQVGFGVGGAFAGTIYTMYGFSVNTILGGLTILGMAFTVWRFLPEPELNAVAK